MHHYSTENNIHLYFSNIIDGNHIEVKFEREAEHNWASATIKIPDYRWEKSEAFTKDELATLMDYVKTHSSRIWQIAQKTLRVSIYEVFCSMSSGEMLELKNMADNHTERCFYQRLFDMKVDFPFLDDEEEEEWEDTLPPLAPNWDDVT